MRKRVFAAAVLALCLALLSGTALALDVDDRFGLVVRRADGTVETVRSGEVSVRGLYGYTE